MGEVTESRLWDNKRVLRCYCVMVIIIIIIEYGNKYIVH